MKSIFVVVCLLLCQQLPAQLGEKFRLSVDTGGEVKFNGSTLTRERGIMSPPKMNPSDGSITHTTLYEGDRAAWHIYKSIGVVIKCRNLKDSNGMDIIVPVKPSDLDADVKFEGTLIIGGHEILADQLRTVKARELIKMLKTSIDAYALNDRLAFGNSGKTEFGFQFDESGHLDDISISIPNSKQ